MGPILAKISTNGCVSESENVKELFRNVNILCVPMRTFILRQRYFQRNIISYAGIQRLLLVKNDRSRSSLGPVAGLNGT